MKFDGTKFKRILKKTIVIFIIVILIYNILYVLVLPLRVKITSTDDVTNSMKVVTYNVENGFSSSILNKLVEADADIIALQEANYYYENSSYIQTSKVAELLKMNYLVPNDEYISKYGLITLTKYTISTVSAIDYKNQPGTFPRSLLIVKIETPYGIIDVMNTHLSFPTSVSSRYNQIEEIIEQTDNNVPTLLLGDFNTPASLLDPPYWSLSSKFSDGYVAAGGNVYTGRTWTRDTKLLRVDYVWLSNHWQVVEDSHEFLEDRDSDHRGFILNISLA